MSMYYRICPANAHTCSRRECLAGVQDGAVCPNPKFAEKPATRAAPKAKASKAPVSNPFNQWLVEDEDDKLGDQFGADTGDYDGEFADWE